MAIAPEALTTSRSTSTVTVCNKAATGVILRLFEWVDREVPVMGGGVRVVRMSRETGERVYINGPAHPFGVPPEYPIIGGYALTFNVSADFFERWLEQNAESAIVKNKMIFAQPTRERAEAQAREQGALRSGMEPLERDSGGEMIDQRVPRPIAPLVAKVETANRTTL